MEALHSIQNFLKGRPKSFKSMDHAIEWRCAFEVQYTLSRVLTQLATYVSLG